MPMRCRRLVVLAAAVLVASCTSSATSVEPTMLERPAVPDGWHAIASDARDVRLTLPPDVDAIFTAAGIIARERARAGTPEFEIIALGPASAAPQPRSGERICSWLEDASWVPRAGEGGVTLVGPATERELHLPSGPALEVAVTADPGMPSEARAVVHAIATHGGIAVLRFVGLPARIDERANDVWLIALLAEFGDLAADDR
jgi:hypothetical protein